VVLLLRRHLQLRREDLEHHLHVLVTTGLHILVKLQYVAAAACFISEIRIFVTVMDRPKGKGNAMEMWLLSSTTLDLW
jgi:hypothetical protein